MNTPTRQPLPLSRARAQVALAPLLARMSGGTRDLAGKLVVLLDDDGKATVQHVYSELFPLASPASASAQLSKLKGAIEGAANAAGRVLRVQTRGARSAGLAHRTLQFFGPAAELRADVEGLRAIPKERLISGQAGTLLVAEQLVVLLTFNEHEFTAVRRAFWSSAQEPPLRRQGKEANSDDLGPHSGCTVLHHHCRQGNRQSQRAAECLREAYQPLAIIAVGIAFGIDETRQALNDVLVSSFIVDYELAKAHPGRLDVRGARPPASRRLVDAMRQLDVRAKAGAQPWPTLHIGGLLSGEKLIDSLDYREELKARVGQDDIVGGEMEATGLATALDGHATQWLVVKGICDFADGRKTKDKERRQKDAAACAADVVKALIDAGSLSPLARLNDAPTGSSIQARARKPMRWRGTGVHELGDGPWVRDQSGLPTSLETLRSAEPPSDETKQRVEVMSDIRRWLDDPDAPPHYALLGEYGMGKTTTCQRMAQQLPDARESGARSRPALYFDLRKVQRVVAASANGAGHVPTLQEAIEDCLRHGYLSPDGEAPRYEQVLPVIDDGALVIFDGLDEVLARLGDKQGLTFTANLLKVLPESAARRSAIQGADMSPRLLISCRTQFFRSLAEQSNHLTGQHRGAAPASQYRALLLLPFDDAQIFAYLQAAFPQQDARELLARIESVHNLRELAERPFTLSLVARFVPRLEAWRAEGRMVTGATLYREVAREWLIRDQEKQSFKPEDKEQLASDLAAHLWRSGETGLSARELESWLAHWLASQDPHADFQQLPRELLQEDLRNSTFLKRTDAGQGGRDSRFEFAHTSLLEFFLADHLLRALQRGVREDWALPRVSDETLDFLGQMLGERAGTAAAFNNWRTPYLQQASELQLAYALGAYRKGWPMPSLVGMDLRGADLSEWHFGSDDEDRLLGAAQRLDMSGARFEGAKLRRTSWWHVRATGARFDSAKLSQAEFLHCELQGCQWTDAEMDGAVLRDCRREDGEVVVVDGAVWAHGLATGSAAPPASAVLALHSGHSSGVSGCALSPEGRWCLSASFDHTLRLWDAASSECLRVLRGHESWVSGCEFSPDGSWCLSASGDRTLRLWVVASGESLRVLQGHVVAVSGCAFSPYGRWCLSASNDRTLRVWDAASGECLRIFQGHMSGVSDCAFSPDGRRCLSASNDDTLRLWDAASGECLRVLQGHMDGVSGCAFSPDGRWCLSASRDLTLRLWDAASGECLRVLQGHGGWVSECAFSPDGRWCLSASSDRGLRLWDAASGDCLGVLQGHMGGVSDCAFSPDGRWCLSASRDRTLRLWDVASSECLCVFQGHEVGVSGCAFSPDGRWCLSASDDCTLRLGDAASGDCLRVFQGHMGGVSDCAFSTDGRWCVSASGDQTLRLWDAASGECLRVLQGHEDAVSGCAFSPDRRWCLSASDDDTLRLWDVASGECRRVLQGHMGGVSDCAFSPDGGWCLSSSDDRTLRLWDVASGECLRVLQGHEDAVSGCAFSPDGHWCLSASHDRTLRVWDAASGECMRVLRGHESWVYGCAFSPDGRWCLSASDDRTLRLWDAASGECLHVLRGHERGVRSCAFSPDGRWCLSASNDRTLRLWDAASGKCLRVHLVVSRGSAAWVPWESTLLHASGTAWRHLRWRGHDEQGRLRLWPLESGPAGAPTVVQPWRIADSAPTQPLSSRSNVARSRSSAQ